MEVKHTVPTAPMKNWPSYDKATAVNVVCKHKYLDVTSTPEM